MKIFASIIGLTAMALVNADEPKDNVKTYTVSFKETPWVAVLTWYSKETGLDYADTVKIKGNLTIESKEAITLIGVTDLFNKELAKQGLVVSRRPKTFSVDTFEVTSKHPARVSEDELDKYADSEWVSVLRVFKFIQAKDVLSDLKKLSSAKGSIETFGKDGIIVKDDVRHVREILKSIDMGKLDTGPLPATPAKPPEPMTTLAP